MKLSCERAVSRPNQVSSNAGSRASSVRTDKTSVVEWGGGRTFMAETSVMIMEPKYTNVKGSRGPEIRCLTYVTGPIRTAHEARKRTEPKDHLIEKKTLADRTRIQETNHGHESKQL